MMRSTIVAILLLSFSMMTSAVFAGKNIYVDTDANGAGDGSSWADAYNYLQDALVEANSNPDVNEIWVAQAVYKPDRGVGIAPGDRTATFQLINGITIKGGYAGFGQPDPNARDITAYETILSGDLDGNDVPVATSDLLTEPTRAENSYHVVTGSGTDANAILDGFTITAGNANETVSPNKSGAGMYSPDGSPTISNCIFSENSAYSIGGGIYTWDEFGNGLMLSNCTFSDNSASSGGGMHGQYDLTLINCTFSRNTSSSGGGAMYIGNSDAIISNCTFNGNSADKGGGIMTYFKSEPILTNCVFIGNIAETDGGAMCPYVLPGYGMTLINCTFSGNLAGNEGGAYSTSHDDTKLFNCTFSRNSAGSDGGAYCVSVNGGDMAFNNCIFWGNTASGEGPQIAIKTASATVSVDYSDVQGGKDDIYVSAGKLKYYEPNNIKVDPCFVDADGADDTAGTEDDDLHLLWDSPCINVGDPSFVFDVNEKDIDDEPRVMVGRIDMGADEVGEKQADFTRNGRIDTEDLGVFVQSWLTTPIDIDWYILCDLMEDDRIDLKDYADFAADYLWQASWYEP